MARKRTAHKDDVEQEKLETNERMSREPGFPIVGIGASAGGLAACEMFFANMPENTENGMAFVVVQHLDPAHKSILAELVQRYTKMRVYEVEDGMEVEPNSTYIIPPNKDLALLHGRLHLMEPAAPRGLRLPIDFFFRSLAADRGEQSICIVLSGTGTDGTLGMSAVKEVGGMAMVQEPSTAGYDGMPRSAIATRLADYVLPPNQMPAQLISYAKLAFWKKARLETLQPPDVGNWIQHILILLRSHNGHDFSFYKQSTIQRRVERRMAVNQVERIDQYVQFLRQNPSEIDVLFHELLIGVTGFFRDPEAFEALNENAIQCLFQDKNNDEAIRAWVPGCSTGEEAYSIAMLMQEQLERSQAQRSIQIFATDIDHQAIEKARTGVYPASIVADVSPERLGRFFEPEQDFYRIKKFVRDLVVFAEQDVIKDPPFSRIDLVSCRNLLIYMGPELQKKVLSLFYYGLRQGGYLFLGPSESIGELTNLYEPVERKWKLYQSKPGGTPPEIDGVPAVQLAFRPGIMGGRELQKPKKPNIRELTEKSLLTQYAPASVLVDDRGEILYVYGRTGKYLELPPGEATNNLLRSVREGLRLELTTAFRLVTTQNEPVRYNGLRVKTYDGYHIVNLIVHPVEQHNDDPRMFLVVFEDAVVEPPGEASPGRPVEDMPTENDLHIASLERELHSKEEYLQTTIEELETTNEELQSTNEELQSTNEELETSKEELQSVNEELVTVNTELQQKIESLSRVNNDMINLLAGTGIGTIFVNHSLLIQRFTPAAARIINLIPTDVGRPLNHIVSNLVNYDQDRLVEDTRAVLEDLKARECEVQAKNGAWYLMRVLPYRTQENVIEGAVITFVEITETRRTQARLVESESRFAKAFFDAPVALTIVSEDEGRFIEVNDHFATLFGYSREELIGHTSVELGLFPSAEERARVSSGITNGGVLRNEEVRLFTKSGDGLYALISVVPMMMNNQRCLMGTVLDITARKKAEIEREKLIGQLNSSQELQQALSTRLMQAQENERRVIARELHDEIGQALTALKINLQTLQRKQPGGLDLEESLDMVEAALQELRAISHNLPPTMLEDLGLAPALRWLLDRQGREGKFTTTFTSRLAEKRLPPQIEIACFRVAQEALTNVLRHAHAHQVAVELTQTDQGLHLTIQDDGEGFDIKAAYENARHGTSLGLISMQERVYLAGGSMEIESDHKQGTKIHALFSVEQPASGSRPGEAS